jgi:hypothetical protein
MIINSKIPIRVHWSRKADSKKPENTKYVGRPTNKKYWPGRWGNPYVTKKYGGPYTNAEAVELYREYVKDRHTEIIAELRGKNLMCKCSLNEPCHADVLLEIANR